ncbi:MAG TPA: hypothetical protein VIH91_02385 [Terriglobales bacterium]
MQSWRGGFISASSHRPTGLDELFADSYLVLLEWGEKFPRLVREHEVEIVIERRGEREREISVKLQ